MTNAKKERYRRIRGAILKLLAHEHPEHIDIKVLHFLLDDLGYTMTEEELMSHLVYLAEPPGECIRIETRKSTGVRINMVVITRRGLNLIDGFDKECGVDVRF